MHRPELHAYFTRRRAGVLLHPTSLPGVMAYEGLADNAIRFMDFLVESGFSIWQMLPLQPVDENGSPYQCSSIHAGNPRFITLQSVNKQHWVTKGKTDCPGGITRAMADPFAAALRCFEHNATQEEKAGYEAFKIKHGIWLDDYAMYSAIKKLHDDKPWWDWPAELGRRDTDALNLFHREHCSRVERYRFEQYLFFSQWQEIRGQANKRNILLFGDMPIFIAHDSADVWAQREYFQLDDDGQPVVVAGVPPDYFSATGQRWGNPLYNWDRIAGDNFQWWIERIRTQLELFDLLRLDHFRGFEAVWEIEAAHPTAVEGKWRPVPGHRLLQAIYDEFGELPLIAEDLGSITPEVIKLRREFNLPGMKVLQFAFDSDAQNPYLPHNHELQYLVVTGTHDNNTTVGWYNLLAAPVQTRIMEYLSHPAEEMPWPLIRAALASVCRLAILPMQDVLGLDADHRMNTPGTTTGNWQWQFKWDRVTPELAKKLKQMNELYGRCL